MNESELLKIAEQLPKTELHLHLDGSLTEGFCKRKAEELGISLSTIDGSVGKWARSRKRTSMKGSLSIFDFFNQFLQTKENLTQAVIELVEELKAFNVVYAEIRFCPWLHSLKGLTYSEICETVVKAFQSTGFPGGIIVCGLRQDDPKLVEAMFDIGLEYGALGLDIAGNEQDYQFSRHEDQIKKVSQKGNLTLHSGEWPGSLESVRDALDFGASRLGHGCEIVKDETLMEQAKKQGICIECCPISNVGSGKISSFEEHPIKQMLAYGLDVCLNSDNLLLSGGTETGPSNPNTNIVKMLATGIGLEELERMTICSVNHVFNEDIDKEELKKRIQQGYKNVKAKLGHKDGPSTDFGNGICT